MKLTWKSRASVAMLLACLASSASAQDMPEVTDLEQQRTLDRLVKTFEDAFNQQAKAKLPEDVRFAVLPPVGDQKAYLESQLEAALVRQNMQVFTRRDETWDKLMGEFHFDDKRSDMMDENTLKQFGKIPGVNYLVDSKLWGIEKSQGDSLLVARGEFRVYEIETGRVVWSSGVIESSYLRRYEPGDPSAIAPMVRGVTRELASKAFNDAVENLATKLQAQAAKLEEAGVKKVVVLPVTGAADRLFERNAAYAVEAAVSKAGLSLAGGSPRARSLLDETQAAAWFGGLDPTRLDAALLEKFAKIEGLDGVFAVRITGLRPALDGQRGEIDVIANLIQLPSGDQVFASGTVQGQAQRMQAVTGTDLAPATATINGVDRFLAQRAMEQALANAQQSLATRADALKQAGVKRVLVLPFNGSSDRHLDQLGRDQFAALLANQGFGTAGISTEMATLQIRIDQFFKQGGTDPLRDPEVMQLLSQVPNVDAVATGRIWNVTSLQDGDRASVRMSLNLQQMGGTNQAWSSGAIEGTADKGWEDMSSGNGGTGAAIAPVEKSELLNGGIRRAEAQGAGQEAVDRMLASLREQADALKTAQIQSVAVLPFAGSGDVAFDQFMTSQFESVLTRAGLSVKKLDPNTAKALRQIQASQAQGSSDALVIDPRVLARVRQIPGVDALATGQVWSISSELEGHQTKVQSSAVISTLSDGNQLWASGNLTGTSLDTSEIASGVVDAAGKKNVWIVIGIMLGGLLGLLVLWRILSALKKSNRPM